MVYKNGFKEYLGTFVYCTVVYGVLMGLFNNNMTSGIISGVVFGTIFTLFLAFFANLHTINPQVLLLPKPVQIVLLFRRELFLLPSVY